MAMKSNWLQPGPRVQKSVRFTTSAPNKEYLAKETWRKLPPIQEATFVMSTNALKGKATIKLMVSKMLFVRLPNARRSELEARCAQLVSSEQLASWWQQFSPSNQVLIPPAKKPTIEMESDFCEAMAEIHQCRGNQAVMDTLVPLAVPIISAWETSGEIASVEDTNEAALIAAKGKKAGNALGEARSRFTREYERRRGHYQAYREKDLELVNVLARASRFSESCVPVHGTDVQEFNIHFITAILGPEKCKSEVLGTAMAPQRAVAREFAAQQAVANWHICEEVYQRILEPEQLIMNSPKPYRKRDKTRAGKPQGKGGTSQ